MNKLQQSGVRVISVDPRYTDTAALLSAQWIPIRPGTDAAMLIAMAHVIITEGLHDRAYLEKYTLGFGEFQKYVMGQADGVPRTPRWAENITGVPADTIAALAREYALSKPAALADGWAPGRTAYGEQFHRAAVALAAMTGNIGVAGGSSGCGSLTGTQVVPGGGFVCLKMGGGDNPLDASAPLRADSIFYQRVDRTVKSNSSAKFYSGGPSTSYLNRVRLADAILKGRSGGYAYDYRLLYMVSINYVNQYANTNRIIQALKKLEFVVGQEQFMTPTAKFADIVLPTNTYLERNDLGAANLSPLYGYMNKAIESVGEAKSPFEIASGLAAKLGISDFSDNTEEEWLREVARDCKDIPDLDVLKKEGFHKVSLSRPYIAFEPQIEDPTKNRFPTPSGKIEIYSQDLADLRNPKIPPVPQYIETWEGRNDPLAKKYPLQLITSHFKTRVHTQFDNVPWLKELDPQAVTINRADARDRGIENGDSVRVFNDRGQTVLPANVTERIMPGVVDVPEGRWYHPDEKNVDRGGCANVLTRDEPSPGGAFCGNTALVQVEKV